MGSGTHFFTIFGLFASVILAGSLLSVICVSASPNDNYSESMEGMAEVTRLSHAPLNPEFLDYQNQSQKNMVSRNPQTITITYNNGSTSRAVVRGIIPSPVDLTHTTGQHIITMDSGFPVVGASNPGSYDLRTHGKVTSVKDQGNAGSCWAFATVASLESYSLPAESLDFSENHMKNTLASTYADGFDRNWDGGGSYKMSTAYLTRWSGPISESDDPYNEASGLSPTGLSPVKHVQNVYFLPERANSTDNENIKNALTTWGAVAASIHFSDTYYRDDTYAFYNGVNTSTNHGITIVGWNDSYSRTNFATQPSGDGAFIAKNSWGTEWGDQGYFYISYYDMTIGKSCSVFTSDNVSNYDHAYYYDPLGWTASFGYTTSTAQFANIFTSQSDEILRAVGFYTPTTNTNYIVSIYLSPNNGPINSGGFAARTSGTISSPGYHTVQIPEVNLSSGQNYSLVVSVTTPGYNYPIPIEMPFSGYSSHATAQPGQSYVSSSGVTWTDLTSISGLSSANVCLKGYTKSVSDSSASEGIAIFRNSTGYWYFDNDLKGTVDRSFRFGESSDQIIKGNWSGTGADGIALFRPSTGYWYFDNNLDGTPDKSFRYGSSNDQIIAGDWRGDGKDGIAIFRPSTGYWYFDDNLDGIVNKSFRYGGSTDQIIRGNWNGSRDGIAIFRPLTGYWYFDYDLDGTVDKSFRYGGSSDRIISGDWDGDGKDGIAIFRPSTGYWYLDDNLDGIVNLSFRYGGNSDRIISGDWDGDGKDGIAIFRPLTGYWYFDNNLDGAVDNSFRFGGTSDQIIAGTWT